MLEAMSRSIDAARSKRTTPTTNTWSGSSEGTTSSGDNLTIGSPVAAKTVKRKRKPKSPAEFLLSRSEYLQ